MSVEISNEAYIAGALLIDGDKVIKMIRGIVDRNDFHVESYGAIYSASLSLASDDKPIDPASISARAKQAGVELSRDLLVGLMESTPTAANCVEYAHRVAEDARTRKIKELAIQIQEDDTSSPDELLATLQRESEAIRGSNFVSGILSPADTLRRFTDHMVDAGNGRCNFIPSGYPLLDNLLGGGFIRGGLYIIGARPAMGKSTFAINLADTISGNVLFATFEMSPEQITAKRISRLTGIPFAKLMSGRVTDDDWTKIALANAELSKAGVYVNTRYDLTAQKIQLFAQSIPNLRAIVIDYLGLIESATRNTSRYECISAISRDLKRMAISLDVPVVCLCQLSRATETRNDKRPMLSDLRDSGSIEQDADAVLLMYRPDYYGQQLPEGQASRVQIDVAKNRHGRTGQVDFLFWMDSSTFKDVIPDR